MKTIKDFPPCPMCGKHFGQRKTEEVRCVGDAPNFATNQQVMGKVTSYTTTEGKTVHVARAWDGETFWRPYEPFCTLRCGWQYGVWAHRRREP